MTIELSKAQYVSLLKIAFLGRWVANSFRYDRLQEFDAIEQHVMSYAKQFGANDIAGYVEKLKQWFPTKEMELAMHVFIDEYNDDYFYEELVESLARRDVLHKFGDEYEGMTIKEKIKIEQPFLDRYYDEIEKNGLENIGIIHDDGTRGSDRKLSIN
jgi:hypothetical protein